MSPADAALLVAAGGLAGTVNAIAGGGTFFTFAALTATGISPLAANATSAVAMLAGQVASTLAYRRELAALGTTILPLAAVSAIGGLAGGWLLLHSGGSTFQVLVPWLLLGATLLFAASPWIAAWTRKRPDRAGHRPRAEVGALVIQALVAVYGGYFGAGMGIMMLASLSLVFGDDFHAGNAAKNLLAVLMQGFAVVLFLASGIVHWPEAAVVIVSGTAGGWFGVKVARFVPPSAIRAAVVLTGLALTLWFTTR